MYLFEAVPYQRQKISHSFPQDCASWESEVEQAAHDLPRGIACLHTEAYRSPVTECVREP